MTDLETTVRIKVEANGFWEIVGANGDSLVDSNAGAPAVRELVQKALDSEVGRVSALKQKI